MATDIQAQTAARFLDLQRELDAKPLEESIELLRHYGYTVTKDLTADADEDDYVITRTWTEKGVRHYAALAELCDGLWVKADELADRDHAPRARRKRKRS